MAVYFPTETCHLFSPGHHVHGIQWRESLWYSWQPATLLSREATTCRVIIGGADETWVFHDEDAPLLATWREGDPAGLSRLGLLRLPQGGYLYPCRKPEDWRDCMV